LSKHSKARVLRARRRRVGSGSAPHDRRRASRHATPLSFASGHASERTAVVLTPSADPRQAPGSRQALVCSGSNTLVAYVPIDKNGCLRPPQPHPRSVRDLQIPIARPQPNRASSSPRFPPYEAFERRPPSGPVRLQRAASEPLQFKGHANRRLYLAFGREARLRASARERPECTPESSFDRKRKTAFRPWHRAAPFLLRLKPRVIVAPRMPAEPSRFLVPRRGLRGVLRVRRGRLRRIVRRR
jgi:hypothetical protein